MSASTAGDTWLSRAGEALWLPFGADSTSVSESSGGLDVSGGPITTSSKDGSASASDVSASYLHNFSQHYDLITGLLYAFLVGSFLYAFVVKAVQSIEEDPAFAVRREQDLREHELRRRAMFAADKSLGFDEEEEDEDSLGIGSAGGADHDRLIRRRS